MNKYFLKFLIAGFSVFIVGLTSCKKNNSVVDQDVVPPTYAKFNVVSASDSAKTYFVKSTGETLKLPVGITTVSDKDRTVNFTYTSTSAVQGVQYSAPASLTIPAGSALDSLEITGLFAGIAVGEVDTIKIQISGTDDVPASPYKSYYFLYLRKSCPIVINDFVGNYDNTYDNAGSYGPYTTTITPGSITMITPTKASFTIENVYDLGAPTIITVEADWTLSEDYPIVTVADQEYFAGLDLWIKGTMDGSFSACDQTLTIYYTLYYHTTGVDAAADQETTLRR
ncbi:MAG: hypothetical protein ABIT58_06680 [Ferruginibacter sp.]